MPKIDTTTSFINNIQHKPDFVRIVVSPNDAPPHRINVPRLSLSGFSKPLAFSFASLADLAITSALPNHAFFVDTCFVKKEVPQECWNALLTKTLCVTPMIDYELRQWQHNPMVNLGFHSRYKKAQVGNDDQIVFLPTEYDDVELTRAVTHYVSLLAFRKDIFRTMRDKLINDTGTEPSEESIHSEVQKLVRERGMTIASKGRVDSAKPNFTADEDLIVRAFVFALTTGRDVTVLTRDKDLSEQFYKLQYLIDTHYRSFLLAEAFVQQPPNFRRYDSPDFKLEMDGFESIEIYQMPAGMTEQLLPEKYEFVNIHVNRIMESGPDLYHTELRFSADAKMAEMLRAKGRTNGLNTDLLDGKNLHRCTHPDLQELFGTCMGVAKDRFVKNKDGRWSLTDIQLAITRCERGGVVQEIQQPRFQIGRERLSQVYGVANLKLPRRLTPVHSRQWESTNIETVGLAIEIMKPWTTFLVSRELLTDLPKRLIEALSSKDCFAISSAATHFNTIKPIDPLLLSEGRRVVDYYTALLSHRKMFGRWCKDSLSQELNREPSLNEVKKELISYCDPSCWFRAKDYLDGAGNANVFDDEHLVVDAFFRAVCNGRETVILTKRTTLIDQFWTLASLMQSHYRGWALARTGSTRLGEVVLNLDEPAPCFRSNLLATKFSPAQLRECLPAHSLEVDVQAWCLDGDLSNRFSVYSVGFPVEIPMVEMFRIKVQNRFCVHNWDDGRNVHVQYAADERGNEFANCFVGIDRQVRIGSKSFPSDPRLPLVVNEIPAFDITLMTAMEKRIPFRWALKERSNLYRKDQKTRIAKLNKRRKR